MTDPSQPGDDALKAADSPTLVKLAAAAMALSGILIGLSGVQVLGIRGIQAWIGFVPYTLMALGAAELLLSTQYYRARVAPGYAALSVAAFNGLVMIAWFFFASLNGLYSCMVVMATPLALGAALLAALGIGGLRRTAAARSRLRELGLDLGL